MRILLITMAIAITLGILTEVGLRLVLGLGNPLIYQADAKMGYILAPDQQVRRFDKHIAINHYSMRSPEIALKPAPDTLRILLLGDSIANGAWWTDQTATISALMEKQLQSSGVGNTEVLNASANSWGPRNQLAYLQKYGSFGSQIIILLMNTDDLFSAPPNPNIVGKDNNYPDRRPPLALVEFWQRYFGQDEPIPEVPKDKGDIVGINLAAVAEIYAHSLEQQAQFIIGITPLLREITEDPRPYEQKARLRLQQFTQDKNIAYVDFLATFKTIDPPTSLFRDTIHLTPQGNNIVTNNLTETVEKILVRTSQNSP